MNFKDKNFELQERQTLQGHTARVWSVAWRPNSGINGVPAVIASCSEDKTARILEQSSPTGSFQCKAVLEGIHTKTVRSCSWSSSGKYLATASFDATTAIWKEDAGGIFGCVYIVKGHDNEVESVSWSGMSLATCGRDKTVLILDLIDSTTEVGSPNVVGYGYALQGHTEDVKMVQWHPLLSTVFSCSSDNTIKVWTDHIDEDSECAETLNQYSRAHTSTVWALSFNATGNRMVSCSDDLTIKIWGSDIERQNSGDSGDPWRHLYTLSGYHDRTIFSVDWSREGIISSGGGDNAICLFVEREKAFEPSFVPSKNVHKTTYRLLHKKENAHGMKVNAVQWSPTETRRLASASDDGTIKIWELVSSPGKNLPSQ